MRPEDQKKWLLMGQNIMLPNQTDLSFVFYDDDDDDDDVDGSLSSLLVSSQNGSSCFCDHCAHHQFKAPVRFLHYLKDFSEMSNLHFGFHLVSRHMEPAMFLYLHLQDLILCL